MYGDADARLYHVHCATVAIRQSRGYQCDLIAGREIFD